MGLLVGAGAGGCGVRGGRGWGGAGWGKFRFQISRFQSSGLSFEIGGVGWRWGGGQGLAAETPDKGGTGKGEWRMERDVWAADLDGRKGRVGEEEIVGALRKFA